MHPFASYCIGSLGGGGGLRGGGGDVVCKRLALASAGVVSLGVPSTGVVPIGAAVDDEGDGAGSRGDVATDNPHNSASAAASTTKVPRRNRADVIQNLTHSLQGAAGGGTRCVRRRSCSQKVVATKGQKKQRANFPKQNRVVLGAWAETPLIRNPSERKEGYFRALLRAASEGVTMREGRARARSSTQSVPESENLSDGHTRRRRDTHTHAKRAYTPGHPRDTHTHVCEFCSPFIPSVHHTPFVPCIHGTAPGY